MKTILFCCFSRSSKHVITYKDTIQFVPPITEGVVIKVYDGDTITIASKLPYDSSPLYRFQVRLTGIDAPEMKGQTEEEKTAAKLAQQALESMIINKKVYLEDRTTEKYGRILANVYFIADNKQRIHLNKWMLDNGYAVEYDGKTKQPFISLYDGVINSI
jgi:endonuclease YncB( thermonuclease family)